MVVTLLLFRLFFEVLKRIGYMFSQTRCYIVILIVQRNNDYKILRESSFREKKGQMRQVTEKWESQKVILKFIVLIKNVQKNK